MKQLSVETPILAAGRCASTLANSLAPALLLNRPTYCGCPPINERAWPPAPLGTDSGGIFRIAAFTIRVIIIRDHSLVLVCGGGQYFAMLQADHLHHLFVSALPMDSQARNSHQVPIGDFQ